MYQYNMPELYQGEFEKMRGFVEDAFRDSIRGNIRPAPMALEQATQDLSETPWPNETKAADKYAGFAWPGERVIWVKPGRPDFDMKRTTIHELSHLRVDGESHGPKFRRVYGVALATYMHSLGKDWLDISREINAIVHRYRHYRAWTPQGRYNSPRDYQDKVYAEVETILKAAKRVCNVWL